MSPPAVPEATAPEPAAAAAARTTVQATGAYFSEIRASDRTLPQITLEALESVKAGMKEAEVLQSLANLFPSCRSPKKGC